jgi:hypothetical protein
MNDLYTFSINLNHSPYQTPAAPAKKPEVSHYTKVPVLPAGNPSLVTRLNRKVARSFSSSVRSKGTDSIEVREIESTLKSEKPKLEPIKGEYRVASAMRHVYEVPVWKFGKLDGQRKKVFEECM